jgi:hypothetical protein
MNDALLLEVLDDLADAAARTDVEGADDIRRKIEQVRSERRPLSAPSRISAHPWDEIRSRITTIDTDFLDRIHRGGGIHESLFRSYAILDEVKRMLVRGDSAATIAVFIEWAEGQEMTPS